MGAECAVVARRGKPTLPLRLQRMPRSRETRRRLRLFLMRLWPQLKVPWTGMRLMRRQRTEATRSVFDRTFPFSLFSLCECDGFGLLAAVATGAERANAASPLLSPLSLSWAGTNQQKGATRRKENTEPRATLHFTLVMGRVHLLRVRVEYESGGVEYAPREKGEREVASIL